MLVAGAVDVFVITDVRLPRMSGSTTAFLARNFNVKVAYYSFIRVQEVYAISMQI